MKINISTEYLFSVLGILPLPKHFAVALIAGSLTIVWHRLNAVLFRLVYFTVFCVKMIKNDKIRKLKIYFNDYQLIL